MAGHFLPNLVKSLVGVKGSESGSSGTSLGYRSELLGFESLSELGLLISPKVWRHLKRYLKEPSELPGCVNGQYWLSRIKKL